MTHVVARVDPRECLHRHLTVEKVDAAGVATTIRCVDCNYWWGDDEVWPIPYDIHGPDAESELSDFLNHTGKWNRETNNG